MAKQIRTGITMTCNCGATDVPVGWPKAGHDDMRLYKHKPGVPYSGPNTRGEKCLGPKDFYLWAMSEAKIFMVDRGVRLGTQEEIDAGILAVPIEDGMRA